jgi:hypothetical protein
MQSGPDEPARPAAVSPAVEPPPAPAAAPASATRIHWEALSSSPVSLWRSKVPGGWLVAAGQSQGSGVCFYPDPDHSWDGSSLA